MRCWRSLLTLLALIALSAGAAPWTLEQALDYALTNSPDLRIAAARVKSAQAQLEQAGAVAWPRLTFQSGYTRTDNPMQVFGSILNQRSYTRDLDFNDVPDVDNLNVKGLVTMPLYTGGRTRADKAAAQAGSGAASYERLAVENALAFEVVRTFHSVNKAREMVRAAESTVAAYETNVALARKRLEAGTLLKAEALDFEVRLAQAREDLVRASNGVTLTIRALRNLLGIDTGSFEVAGESQKVSAPASEDFSRRPELMASRLQERAAEEQVRSRKAGYRPHLSAFGSIDYDRGWETDGDGTSYTAGVLLQWDIWDGNLTRARTRAASADLEAAREQSRKVRLALDLEAERGRLELKSASERLAVAEQAVAMAAESANLTRTRFEQGAALSSQVIDSENALLSARVRRAEAESDYRIAVGALRKALGIAQLDRP